MERAARVLRKGKLSRSILDDSQAIEATWPAAVGKSIARHTNRLRLVRSVLVVEVEDAIWQRQLRTLEAQILNRIKLLLPDVPLAGLEFRVGVPRRDPQRAPAAFRGTAHLFASASDDEADRIQDPVLKKVYQISRRKASA
jgi:predicted nucleic acid-binding Zn ribbon protein